MHIGHESFLEKLRGRYDHQRTLVIRIAAITLASDSAITIARFRPSKFGRFSGGGGGIKPNFAYIIWPTRYCLQFYACCAMILTESYDKMSITRALLCQSAALPAPLHHALSVSTAIAVANPGCWPSNNLTEANRTPTMRSFLALRTA